MTLIKARFTKWIGVGKFRIHSFLKSDQKNMSQNLHIIRLANNKSWSLIFVDSNPYFPKLRKKLLLISYISLLYQEVFQRKSTITQDESKFKSKLDIMF